MWPGPLKACPTISHCHEVLRWQFPDSTGIEHFAGPAGSQLLLVQTDPLFTPSHDHSFNYMGELFFFLSFFGKQIEKGGRRERKSCLEWQEQLFCVWSGGQGLNPWLEEGEPEHKRVVLLGMSVRLRARTCCLGPGWQCGWGGLLCCSGHMGARSQVRMAPLAMLPVPAAAGALWGSSREARAGKEGSVGTLCPWKLTDRL